MKSPRLVTSRINYHKDYNFWRIVFEKMTSSEVMQEVVICRESYPYIPISQGLDGP